MLTTFRIGPHTGRVCYVTSTENKHSVTIECPEEKLALRFETDKVLKIGEWVEVRGETRVDASFRSDGTPAESGAYYHQPHDGSDKARWTFKQLMLQETGSPDDELTTNGSSNPCVLIGPPEFSKRMHAAMLCLRRHLDSWEKNLELSRWEETAATLKGVLELVESEVMERKPVPVVAPQISDL